MGVSAARNRGMKETDGRWLCFIDGDDWVTPSYLQELVSAVEDGACDLVVEGLCSVRAGKKDEVTVPQPMELDARPERRKPGYGCSVPSCFLARW